MNDQTRYSDEDLKGFEDVINAKLNRTYEQLESLQAQVIELEESIEDSAGAHYMNDGNVSEQLEFLNGMIYRQQKHISDLEKAMMRIKNKTYGRCVMTGELIDKNRLMAVPTTTKSLLAKTQGTSGAAKQAKSKITMTKAEKPLVYSRVVRKVQTNPVVEDKALIDKSVDFVDVPFEDDDNEETYFDTVSETVI